MPPSEPTSPNIVSIFDGEPTAQGPVPDIIELLEEVLAEARDGRLRSILVVATRHDGGFDSSWYDHGQGFRLAGHVAMAQRNLLNALAGED